MKRRFVAVSIASCALIAWLVRTVAGGVLYATAAFFTKHGWEKWKSRRERRS